MFIVSREIKYQTDLKIHAQHPAHSETWMDISPYLGKERRSQTIDSPQDKENALISCLEYGNGNSNHPGYVLGK